MIKMIKRVLFILMTLVLFASSAFAYGGGSSAAIIVAVKNEINGDLPYEVETFAILNKQKVYVDCVAKTITIGEETKKFVNTCNFDWLKADSIESFDVYRGKEKFAVVTKTYGTPVTISIAGHVYNAETNNFQFYYKAPIVEVKKNETSVLVIKNETKDEVKKDITKANLKSFAKISKEQRNGKEMFIAKISYPVTRGNYIVTIPKSHAINTDFLEGNFVIIEYDPVIAFNDVTEITYNVVSETEPLLLEDVSIEETTYTITTNTSLATNTTQSNVTNELTNTTNVETTENESHIVGYMLAVLTAIAFGIVVYMKAISKKG